MKTIRRGLLAFVVLLVVGLLWQRSGRPMNFAPSTANAEPASAHRPPLPAEVVEKLSKSLARRIQALDDLEAGRFAEVSEWIRSEQGTFEADPRREGEALQAWSVFAIADPALTPRFDEWAREDDSYAPLVARGLHHRRSGWAARGVRRSSKTSESQFLSMREHHDRAEEDLRRAIASNPKLAVAYQTLINLGKQRKLDEHAILAASIAQCPSCIGPRSEYLSGLAPRWGGSFEEMERFIAELKPEIDRYPNLAPLAGGLAFERAQVATFRPDYELAVRLFDEALAHGDYWAYRRYRGQSYYRLGRYEDALADHDYWLEHGARTSEALRWRAMSLAKLNRAEEAVAPALVARRLAPADRATLDLAEKLEQFAAQSDPERFPRRKLPPDDRL